MPRGHRQTTAFIASKLASYILPRSRRQAITAAGMGCQAAIEAERWLAENES